MEMISKHISLEEATRSSTAERLGIDNTPTEEIIEVMKLTAEALFEPVRNHYGCRIAVPSFFRSEELNKALSNNGRVAASKKSQHLTGEAMDMDAQPYGGCTNKQVFEYIRDNLVFDQLIWEEGTDDEPEWVHVSRRSNEGAKNRKEVLRKFRTDGKTRYEKL